MTDELQGLRCTLLRSFGDTYFWAFIRVTEYATPVPDSLAILGSFCTLKLAY